MQKTKIIVKSKYQIDFINFPPLVVVRRINRTSAPPTFFTLKQCYFSQKITPNGWFGILNTDLHFKLKLEF